MKKFLFPKRKDEKPRKALSYISAEDTLRKASAENLSVGDYVEKIWDQQGLSDKVTDQILRITKLPSEPAIVEIGTGTGRYLEKMIQRVKVSSYESYEIAEDWNEYLRRQYKEVNFYQAEGSTLSLTADKTIDLVVAHGVFTYLPLLVAISYFKEVDRVVRAGGYCIFDCFTEKCFEGVHLNNWLQGEHRYPVIFPSEFMNGFFLNLGFSCIGRFNNKYGQGISEYLVFQKND